MAKKSRFLQLVYWNTIMIKKTIYLGSKYYVSLKHNQLVLSDKERGFKKSIPLEDIGVVEIDHPQILLTGRCLSELVEYNIAVVVCNERHHPNGLFLSIDGNSIQTKRFRQQLSAKQPLLKNLWAKVIKAKIKNQYLLLKKYDYDFALLKNRMGKVKSGDSGNQEAVAAGYYWDQMFDDKFSRDRFGDFPNNMLNYGYSILRANCARAVVSAGLHPSLGIFHKNKYNSYCLADDIMEPFRPYVDEIVLNYWRDHPEDDELSKDHKQLLLNIAYKKVKMEKKTNPLMNAVQFVCSSLNESFETGEAKLKTPIFE